MAYNYLTQWTSPNATPADQTRSVWGVDRHIKHIVIHWWGDPAQNPEFEGIISTFMNPASQRSAHYIATGTGRRVACLVSPADNAWATVQDNPYSIAIECDPRCRDEDYDVVAELIADIRSAYGNDLALHPHKEFFATSCPGNWDLGRLDALSRQKVSHDQWGQVTNLVPPAPAPEVAQAAVEAATPVAKGPAKGDTPPVNPFVRFASPMNLVANKQPTNVYDTSKADPGTTIVKQLKQGDPFNAVGKYTHPDGNVYFMTAYSFGNADTTAQPDHPYGINTLDLTVAPLTPDPAVAPTPPTSPTDNGATTIPVNVIPADPNKRWQDTFQTYGHGDYIATQTLVIKDLTGTNPDLQLLRGQTLNVAGTFDKDGVTYYRTAHSVATGKWYGIPEKANGYDTLTEDDNMFDTFLKDEIDAIEREGSQIKDAAIKTVASIDGIFSRFKHKK